MLCLVFFTGYFFFFFFFFFKVLGFVRFVAFVGLLGFILFTLVLRTFGVICFLFSLIMLAFLKGLKRPFWGDYFKYFLRVLHQGLLEELCQLRLFNMENCMFLFL